MFVEIGDIVIFGYIGRSIPAIVTRVDDGNVLELSAFDYGTVLSFSSVPLDLSGSEKPIDGTYRMKGGRAYGMGASGVHGVDTPGAGGSSNDSGSGE